MLGDSADEPNTLPNVHGDSVEVPNTSSLNAPGDAVRDDALELRSGAAADPQ